MKKWAIEYAINGDEYICGMYIRANECIRDSNSRTKFTADGIEIDLINQEIIDMYLL